MTRKIFYIATVILVLLFAATAIFRVLSAREFKALEFREEGASFDKYLRLTHICETLIRITSAACMIHPFFALAVWLTCQGSLKTTGIATVIAVVIIAAMGYAVPLVTGGRVNTGDINYFFRLCLPPYFKALAVSLILGKVTHRI